MPRQERVRAPARRIAGKTRTSTPGVGVFAPLTNTKGGAGKNAEALAKILGSTGQTIRPIQELAGYHQINHARTKGEEARDDLLLGRPADDDDEYYVYAFERARVQADLAELRNTIREEVALAVDANPLLTPEEVNEMMEARFQQFFQDEDGDQVEMWPANRADAISVLEQVRQESFGMYSEMAREARSRGYALNLQRLMREQYATDGTLPDFAALADNANSADGPDARVMRKELMHTLMQEAINIARESGNPDVLVPLFEQKWSDGQYMFDEDQRNELWAGMRSAAAVSDANEAAALKQLRSDAQMDIITKIFQGRDVTRDLVSYGQSGLLDPSVVRSLSAFQESYDNRLERGQANQPMYDGLMASLYSAPDLQTFTDVVVDKFVNGELGYGTDASGAAEKLFSDAQSWFRTQDTLDPGGTTEFRIALKSLTEAFQPDGQPNIFGGRTVTNPAQARRQRELIEEFTVRVTRAGEDPILVLNDLRSTQMQDFRQLPATGEPFDTDDTGVPVAPSTPVTVPQTAEEQQTLERLDRLERESRTLDEEIRRLQNDGG